jgi:hypothetical protein
MYFLQDFGEVAHNTGRLLVFRKTTIDQRRLGPLHLAFGLGCACLAGIARHWDNPRLGLLQHLGLDSVAYTFVFATILWLVLWPMRPKNWRFSTILIFVSLTSQVAFLYALPSIVFPDTAANHVVHWDTSWFTRDEIIVPVRLWLFLIVAGWPVALLVKFLHTSAGLKRNELFVGTLVLLTLVLWVVLTLNPDRAVFFFKGRGSAYMADDEAYEILNLILFLLIFALPFVALGYLATCVGRWRDRRTAKAGMPEDTGQTV